MRSEDLPKEWKAGLFRPVYLFVGEDAGAKSAALKHLKAVLKPDDFNFAEFSADLDSRVSAITSEALTQPVFQSRRLVVVNNPKIPAALRDALVDYLKNPVETTTLVLFSDDRKADSKSPLVRAVSQKGAVCLFSILTAEEAHIRLKSEAKRLGKEISDEAAGILVAEAGTDWAVRKQELEKSVLFIQGKKEVGSEAVLQCLGYEKAADPFGLVVLIRRRKLKESLAHLKRMFSTGKIGEQVFKALNQINATVGSQLKAKRMHRAGIPASAIYRAIRVNEYYNPDYLRELSPFSEPRLRRDLKLCLNTEVSLKSKAWLDARIEVERLVVDLCR